MDADGWTLEVHNGGVTHTHTQKKKLHQFSSEFLVGWRAEDLEDEEDSTTVMVIPDFFQESLNRLRVENQAYKDRVKAEEELMERMQHRLNTVVSVVSAGSCVAKKYGESLLFLCLCHVHEKRMTPPHLLSPP